MASERQYLLSENAKYSKLDSGDVLETRLRSTKSEPEIFSREFGVEYEDLLHSSDKYKSERVYTDAGDSIPDVARTNSAPPASLPFKSVVVFACLFNLFLVCGFFYGLSVLFVQLIRVFDTDHALVALNQSFFEFFLAIGGVLWSYPVTRLGYGNCVVIGGISGSVCVAFCFLATSVLTVIVLVGVLSGVSYGIIYMSAFVVASDVSDTNQGALISFICAGAGVGQFAFPFAMDACMEEYGWQGTMLIAGGFCLNAVPVGLVMSIHQQRSTALKTRSYDTTKVKRNVPALFKLALFKEKIFLLLMVNSVAQAFSMLIESRFIVDIAELKGFASNDATLFASMMGIGNLLGGMMCSISKLLCHKVLSSVHSAIWMICLTASHAMVLYLDTYTWMMVTAIFNGICLGMLFGHLPVFLYEIYGADDYPPAFASYNVLKGVGNFLGGFIGGIIFDNTGSYDLLFRIGMLLNVFSVGSFVVISIYGRRGRKDAGIGPRTSGKI